MHSSNAFLVHAIGALSLFSYVDCADNIRRPYYVGHQMNHAIDSISTLSCHIIVNIMKVLTLFTFTFAKRGFAHRTHIRTFGTQTISTP